MKTSQKFILLSIIGISSAISINLYSQSKEVNYDDKPLYVDGELGEREVTDTELNYIENELQKQGDQIQLNKVKTGKYKKLQNSTEKLADVTEKYVEEKKESEKVIKEYNKKIKCLLDTNYNDPDCKKYRKNAPAPAPIAAPAEPVQSEEKIQISDSRMNIMDKIRLNTSIGSKTYNNENKLKNIQSNIGVDIGVESNISESLAMGVSLNYVSIDINDLDNNRNNFTNTPYYGGYTNFYGMNGREINITSWGLDFLSKFYFVTNRRFQPYIGLGIGINSLSLDYANNNRYNYQFYQFGNNESFTTTYFDGKIRIGSDFYFTESLGVGLFFGMEKGFMNFSQEQDTPYYQADLVRLEQLAEQFAEAYAYEIYGGLNYAF